MATGVEIGSNGTGTYQGFQSYSVPIPDVPNYRDDYVSVLGRYYDRVSLVPFIPDIYSVAFTQSELIRSQGFRVLDQMMLDDMCAAGVSSWIGNVLTAARFQPADVTDAGEHQMAKSIADFYTAQFQKLVWQGGGFLGKLYDPLEGVAVYGHSVSALPLCIWPEGKWRGYTATADIKWMQPHFLTPGHDPKSGQVTSWWQVDRQSGTSVGFEESEVLHFVRGTTKDPARGRSVLLPAHIHWITKTMLTRLRNHNAEWAVGRIAFEQTVKAEDGGPSKVDYDDFCLEWINNYINRWGIPLPYGVKATLMQSSTISPDVYNAVLRHADQGILRSIGVDWMLQEEPEFGNRALGDVKQGQSNTKSKLTRENFASVCQAMLVDRTARINGWPQRLWPRFTMQPAIEDDKIAVVGQAQAIQGAGLISKQPQDENWYRERLGMPLVKEGATSPMPQVTPETPVVQPPSDQQFSAVGDIYRELKSRHPDWSEDQVKAVMLKKAREAGVEHAERSDHSEPVSPIARLRARLAAIAERHA